MCDTFVVLPDATVNGDLLFGKNSDRPNGEIQDVVQIPSRKFADGELVACTYISIPQVGETLALVLSKPRWMWGAEMGANECGVVIGNEAVWTTESYAATGLLGMDLLRLALERGRSARSALDIIVGLMDAYGQGGNCAEHFAMNYHNSYIIADFSEAWVLETAGEYWVAEKVTKGTRSISNGLSIQGAGDLRHPRMVEDLIKADRIRNEAELNFAHVFSGGESDGEISINSREGRVRHLCHVNEGAFSVETAMMILRDHEAGICWHGPFETRGSQISSLMEGASTHRFIEAPFPCEQEYVVKSV